jgi:hypothetical protein
MHKPNRQKQLDKQTKKRNKLTQILRNELYNLAHYEDYEVDFSEVALRVYRNKKKVSEMTMYGFELVSRSLDILGDELGVKTFEDPDSLIEYIVEKDNALNGD